MNATFFTALAMGLAAPYARSFIWRVPFGMLPLSVVLRTAGATAVSTLIIGALTFWILGSTGTEPRIAEWVAAATAFVGGAILLVSSARRYRHAHAVAVLCQRIQEPDVRDRAKDALGNVLKRLRATSPALHANLVLAATGPLTQAGLWQDARVWLRDVESGSLNEERAAIREQALATCELQFNNIDGARDAIARVERPAPDAIEIWLSTMEALLLAIDGRAEEALHHLEDFPPEDNLSLEASQRVVRAHALASLGRLDDARKQIGAIAEAAGRNGVDRILKPKGPASPLAEEWLDQLQ